MNMNLISMLGLSSITICPKCENSFINDYHDYDVDCNNTLDDGVWELDCYCPFCQTEFKEKYEVQVKQILT